MEGRRNPNRYRQQNRNLSFEDLLSNSQRCTDGTNEHDQRSEDASTDGLIDATDSPKFGKLNSPAPQRQIDHSLYPPPNKSTIVNRPPLHPSPRSFLRGGNKSRVRNHLELKVRVHRIPTDWTTWDVHQFFIPYGDVSRVEILDRGTTATSAIVRFQPPPASFTWLGRPLKGRDSRGLTRVLHCSDMTGGIFKLESPNTHKQYDERMSLQLQETAFGVLKEVDTMIISHTERACDSGPQQLSMDVKQKRLNLFFSLRSPQQSPQKSGSDLLMHRCFKMQFNIAQICQIRMVSGSDGKSSFVMIVEIPPQVFRKTSKIRQTHDETSTLWDEQQTWYRQTEIDQDPTKRASPIQLKKSGHIIDAGRWLTYRVTFDAGTDTHTFQTYCQALIDFNVHFAPQEKMMYSENGNDEFWTWLDGSTVSGKDCVKPATFLDEMQEMATTTIHLPFAVRYQLEVCLSQGIVHECNITQAFLTKLAAMNPIIATRVLEKVTDTKRRYYVPEDILELQNQVSVAQKKTPEYCTKTLAATITPTAIYYATPALETSNRIVRKYKQFEDRFLRVKFGDEQSRRIMCPDGEQWAEVFSRIKRIMTYGIKIGDRVYEFLAFGNSQFREHGAYFFASTGDLTAAKIREEMGSFDHIKVVAKYASRIGQCFSTTRAIPYHVNVHRVQDVHRNGFCFTDGVGMISPFLANLIVDRHGLPNPAQDYSVFQFRLAGLKGVLAVNPSLTGMTVRMRPSQEKFTGPYRGLEICRISQYSAANLNVQIILVLSALGVPDDVFVDKLRKMLHDLSEAMTNQEKASKLLQKNVDFNQTSLTWAKLISEGFMKVQEPFLMSCIRLWRAWSLKYLKEKARIFVEKGAFVMGCTDESGKLKGHFDHEKRNDQQEKALPLPEIFLQIPDPDFTGRYKVMEGICTLNRNPSLHPGDVRVVQAVDVPGLHHLKNCVVLPQTGDRDLANMCSGGDLDGDDYLVMWDPELLPSEWNHAAMDYTSPSPVVSEGTVTVDQMTTFFVNHIKNDNLGRIAVAHRYWADALEDGIKSSKCLELAELHSKAVDYAKTGVPAKMPMHLRVNRWPHWANAKNKAKHKIYHSNKVVGKLYDEVERQPFNAAWENNFDHRILDACEVTPQHYQAAKAIKKLYDDAVRRIMAQYGIESEFEVCTTFVLDHHQDINDYQFAEKLGEILLSLKQHHQELCYEKAGTDARTKDWSMLRPFLVAMYTVTADEVEAALAETVETTVVDGHEVPMQPMTFETMPFISFPWIFAGELGNIATSKERGAMVRITPKPALVTPAEQTTHAPIKGDLDQLVERPKGMRLPDLSIDGGRVREGDIVDLFHQEPDRAQEDVAHAQAITITETNFGTPGMEAQPVAFPAKQGVDNENLNCMEPAPEGRGLAPLPLIRTIKSPVKKGHLSSEAEHSINDDDEDEDEDEPEEVAINIQPSALDRLAALYG